MVFIAGAVVAFLFSLFLLARWFVRRQIRKLLTTHVPAFNDHPRKRGLVWWDVGFTTQDNVKLCGWLVGPLPCFYPRGLVVLLHGYREPKSGGGKSRMLSWAEILARAGYAVLLFDFRGHADSQDARFTFGKDEMHDIQAAYDFVLRNTSLKCLPRILAGVSFGAASAIRFAATHEHDFSGIVAISPYADFRELISERMGFAGRVPVLVSFLCAALRAEIGVASLDELSPIACIGNMNDDRLLIMHGTNDDVVPLHHAEDLLRRSVCKTSFSLTIGGTHGLLLEKTPEHRACRIRASAINFLDRCVQESRRNAGLHVIIIKEYSLLTRIYPGIILAVKGGEC